MIKIDFFNKNHNTLILVKNNMFWLYTCYNLNQKIDFYQIFINCKLIYSDFDKNAIYSISSDNTSYHSTQQNVLNIELDKLKYDTVSCQIKIVADKISYNFTNYVKSEKNIGTNQVFTFRSSCVKKTDGEHPNIIYHHNYKKTNVKEMPNLLKNKYDFNNMLNFKIYNLEKNVQLIIETDPKTNVEKIYFISSDINSVSKYIKSL